MPLLEALRLAFESIWSAKLRSFFTLLGIIVSVGFLVAVVAVIQGMNAYVKENLTGAMIGTNAFQVRRTPISRRLPRRRGRASGSQRRPIVTAEDAETVRRALPDAAGRGAAVGMAHADQRRDLPQPDRRRRC